MDLPANRTLNGALAGAAAAAVWAAQEPLDRRVFDSRYSDVELLGTAVTRGPLWPLVGLLMHIGNGAVFGAVYANLPSGRLPGAARGVAAGLTEHLATWPLTSAVVRIHPAGRDLADIKTARGFWQATWRHALFGFVMGELERRLNPPEEDGELSFEAVISTNGHGRIEDAVSA